MTTIAFTEALRATSTLDAVNILLQSIGESPVTSLDEDAGIDAEAAFNTLIEVSREVQGVGWHFNTDIGYKLSPESDTGHIRLPENTLRVDEVWPDDLQHGSDMVQRGTKLYDRNAHTFAINRPVVADIVVMLAFEELPQYARTYIAIKAARKFAQDETASDALYKFTKTDEQEALVAMESGDSENESANAGRKSPFLRTMLRR